MTIQRVGPQTKEEFNEAGTKHLLAAFAPKAGYVNDPAKTKEWHLKQAKRCFAEAAKRDH